MSYRIIYPSSDRRAHSVSRKLRFPVFTVVFFLLFLILVHRNWPEGEAFLREGFYTLRGTAGRALNTFSDEVFQKESSVTAFVDLLQNLKP